MARDARTVAMNISLATSVVMLTGKLTAYLLTSSVAMFSDAAESVVHGLATGLAAYALWLSQRPADEKHLYGHGRVAYFSAGFEGALVFAAAVTVIGSGILGLIRGPDLRNLGVGLLISAALAVINLVLGSALIRIGRKKSSLILTANGKHVLSDVWTTAAAIIGVGLVMLTGVTWFDPVSAIIIGAWIMITGAVLVRRALGGLMDEVDPVLARRIVNAVQQTIHQGLILDAHQLRFRKVNNEVWMDVHMLVPGEMPTLASHARATQVEESIRRLFPDDTIHITSHIEPIEHAAAHPGGHKGATDPLRVHS